MDFKNNYLNNIRDDQELIEIAMKGEEKAFARLMVKYKDSIYLMLLKIVKNKNDAEDLTLEAFGKAFANLSFYSTEYAFSTWLYRIASNNCIDFLRKKKGTHFSLNIESDIDYAENNSKFRSTSPNPEERMIIKQKERILHNFILKLKPQYRTLINLRYFKEYTYDEIAKELDLPLGTVKVQLFRARNMLFNLVDKTGVTD